MSIPRHSNVAYLVIRTNPKFFIKTLYLETQFNEATRRVCAANPPSDRLGRSITWQSKLDTGEIKMRGDSPARMAAIGAKFCGDCSPTVLLPLANFYPYFRKSIPTELPYYSTYCRKCMNKRSYALVKKNMSSHRVYCNRWRRKTGYGYSNWTKERRDKHNYKCKRRMRRQLYSPIVIELIRLYPNATVLAPTSQEIDALILSLKTTKRKILNAVNWKNYTNEFKGE